MISTVNKIDNESSPKGPAGGIQRLAQGDNAQLEASESRCMVVERDLEERISELAALNELAREMTAALSVDQVIAAAQERIHALVSPDLSMVYLIGEDRRMILRSLRPDSPRFRFQGNGIHEVGTCLCGLAAEERKPAYSENIQTDPRCTLTECKRAGVQSFAALPLLFKGEILGVLGIASFIPRDFSRRADLLEIIASQISTALHSTSLYEAAERYATELDHQLAIGRKIESELREEHSFRSAVIDKAAEGLCVCHMIPDSPHVVFTLWNNLMTEITGYTMEEINRIGWYDALFPEASMQLHALERMEGIKHGNHLNREEWEITRADGEKRTISISTSLIESADGTSHILALVHDVTERKRALEAIKKAHDELEARVAERTEELVLVTESLEREVAERRRAEEALKDSESKLRTLSSRLLEIREEERSRLSREIHDAIAQNLVAVKLMAESAQVTAQKIGAEELQRSLANMTLWVGKTIDAVRKMYMDLRPTVLDDFGIIPAIGLLCGEAREREPSLSIVQDIRVDEREIPKELRTAIFRIVQEALLNAARHSKAKTVTIGLRKSPGEIELAIADDGIGVDPRVIDTKGGCKMGVGLACMDELARLSEGRFALESTPGKGTVIHVRWPF